MNGRAMRFTRVVMEKTKGSYASVDVLVEAKRISVPEIITKIRDANRDGNHILACALTFDMALSKTKETYDARNRYMQARHELAKGGDTGGVVEVEVQWDSRLGLEGEEVIKSKAERLIRDTLYGMYERSNGVMGHAEWKTRAEEIKKELMKGVSEKIEQDKEGSAEFVQLMLWEKKLVEDIWAEGMEMASLDVLGNEKSKPAPRHLTS